MPSTTTFLPAAGRSRTVPSQQQANSSVRACFKIPMPRLTDDVAQTSKSAVSRVSKPADATTRRARLSFVRAADLEVCATALQQIAFRLLKHALSKPGGDPGSLEYRTVKRRKRRAPGSGISQLAIVGSATRSFSMRRL